MSQTNVNIRMDEGLKKEFDEFCKGIGMSMSTAITVFVKSCLREKRIPFSISLESNSEDENE